MVFGMMLTSYLARLSGGVNFACPFLALWYDLLEKGSEKMNTDEIAKDIVIALIEQKQLSSVQDVCNAFKAIFHTVEYPRAEPTTN